MKNLKYKRGLVMPGVAKHLGGAALVVLFVALTAAVSAYAGEIRLTIGDGAFIAKAEQSQEEIFKFDLPKIPAGSRIDFAGLVLYLQRDSVRNDYLFLELLPIAGDWTATSLEGGQVLSVDEKSSAYAVAHDFRNDRIELDITQVVADWVKGEKANRGFVLQTEFAEEKTNFSAKSMAGVKAELVVYYTAPEVKK
jgi:hypothetical protein